MANGVEIYGIIEKQQQQQQQKYASSVCQQSVYFGVTFSLSCSFIFTAPLVDSWTASFDAGLCLDYGLLRLRIWMEWREQSIGKLSSQQMRK